MYGQNKADDKLNDSSRIIVGPTFSIAAADSAPGDLLGGVDIPAGSFVSKVALEVTVVAAGGTAADTEFDVGSIADPNLFLDDVDGAAAVTGMGTIQFITAGQTAAVGAGGWYFSAKDTISAINVAESSTSGSVRILVWLSTPS